jgi:hypothetical protein
VLDQALEHAGGLDAEDELGVRLELQLLDRGGHRVGAAAEAGAVDVQGFAGLGVLVDHHQTAGHVAALLLGHEAELLAVDAEEGLDVLHDRVGLGLLLEARLGPVLRDVVGLSLGGDVVGLDQFLGQGHHLERLGEGLDRPDGQRALLISTSDAKRRFFDCHA